MAKLAYEAVAVVGKDKDGKPKYLKVGAVFESDKGLSLKLDCVPAGNEFNGWINFYTPKPKDGQHRQSAPARAESAQTAGNDFPSDDIPF